MTLMSTEASSPDPSLHVSRGSSSGLLCHRHLFCVTDPMKQEELVLQHIPAIL